MSDILPVTIPKESPRFATKMIICIFTGFASGLPLFLLLQLVPAWLKSGDISIKSIGALALTQFPYMTKFLWSSLIDRTSPLGLGRRRGWMLISQLMLAILIITLGFCSFQQDLWLISVICFTISFFSATQDIAIDAFRRELLTDHELGLGNSIHINAYRIAGLVPGSLSLILSDHLLWHTVFIITALFMIPSMIMTLIIKEPINNQPKSHSFQDIIIKPFSEFITRNGLKSALTILAFIFLYKLGDSMATSLATPFYLDMGYSRSDIGTIAKHASLWPSIIGAFLGGIFIAKKGNNRALWLFGLVQVISIFGFVYLAIKGPFAEIGIYQKILLAIVIGFEALGVGLGSVALITFITKNINPLYVTTQFALFSSVTSTPRILINATTGVMVAHLGWANFFGLCIVLAIPGMLLLFKVAPWNTKI